MWGHSFPKYYEVRSTRNLQERCGKGKGFGIENQDFFLLLIKKNHSTAVKFRPLIEDGVYIKTATSEEN